MDGHTFLDELSNETIIKNNIYSILGWDALDETGIPLQARINSADIWQKLFLYYSACPFTNGCYVDNLLKTQRRIDLNLVRPSQSDEWFYIGITGEGRIYNYSSNLLDTRLLGIARSFFFTDPLQKQYVSSSIGENIGKPEYFYDKLNNTIEIVSGGDAITSLTLAWGSKDLRRLEGKHLKGISTLISIPYYERVIGMRDQLSFSTTDYKFNPELLRNRLDRSIKESEEWLKKIRPHVVLKR